MFYPQRIVDVKDGITKFAGLDKQSDILDDDGNFLKKWEDVKKEEEKQENGSAKRQKLEQKEGPPHPNDPKEGKL